MLGSKLFRKFLSAILISLFIWVSCFPCYEQSAIASTTPLLSSVNSVKLAPEIQNSQDWTQVDLSLQQAIKQTYAATEEFATQELDDWGAGLMDKVDKNFLSWYFSYINQKSMELGVPFAWLAFKVDFLNLIKKEDEKKLDAAQIIQKRMIEDFNTKFKEIVLNNDSEQKLKNILNRIARNYSSSIGMQFSLVKVKSHISDQDWQRHLEDISSVIYDTGTTQSNLSADSLNSNLFTKISTLTTIAIGTKIAAKFAIKASSKVAAKAGGTIVLKTGAQLLDPILAVGFLVWDIWDYQHMVAESKPALRKNIADYLKEMKGLLLEDDAGNGIMDAIVEIQNDLLDAVAN